MPRTSAGPGAPPLRALPAAALRAVLREGYGPDQLRADLLAGAVVGVVALPLAMALAIAVGAPPQAGLYTAIVGGFVIAALGGSRLQVSGPTAAFIVVLAPITAQFGLGGLLVAGLMGGLILAALGLFRLGRLIEFIPHPVTTGFTSGIATVIATLQLKDLLGLQIAQPSPAIVERVRQMAEALGTFRWQELAVGAFTLAVLLFFPKLTRKIPAPLVALPAAAVLGAVLASAGLSVDTLQSRFGGVPRLPPLPMWPWEAGGPGGAELDLSFTTLRALLPGAFAIAMLGAIESLLSAVVADGMARTRHDPDAELIAQGVGNVVAPFFGGIPATGAIARTATGIRSGARSPVAAMVHAVVVLAAVLALGPILGYLPMAGLAALLVLVAINMSEARHFVHTLKVAPRSDVAVLLTCFSLTVLIDMVVAVSAGVVLAALLFMRRMAEVTEVQLVGAEHASLEHKLPAGVILYDVDGPLFFGAAQKAMGALSVIADNARVVILRLEDVPAMDATGLVALESALLRLEERKVKVILTGVRPQPLSVLRDAGLTDKVVVIASFPDALAAAERQVNA